MTCFREMQCCIMQDYISNESSFATCIFQVKNMSDPSCKLSGQILSATCTEISSISMILTTGFNFLAHVPWYSEWKTANAFDKVFTAHWQSYSAWLKLLAGKCLHTHKAIDFVELGKLQEVLIIILLQGKGTTYTYCIRSLCPKNCL